MTVQGGDKTLQVYKKTFVKLRKLEQNETDTHTHRARQQSNDFTAAANKWNILQFIPNLSIFHKYLLYSSCLH